MYELVNTSLPNGLIAGTHGFATVAMTKGVSDVLRGRLEALCAYTHRTSAHDTTYYQQNPVNWFHIVLPQGEHVIGRVAPSEFDYTGRTNRLAKLRIFGAQEMPSVGAADVLQKEKAWFSQEWQGDPRYLDEDRNTCGHLRMLNPVQASSAPAWDALFGANGSRLAQQFAWQLEKNVSSGGKAIYFKTSASFDVSGECMLGLFADLINLLPPNIRAKVTFSTYPVSLPSGTICHLRGIYDRDKFFDATAATQAWVDCENAKIVHPEMLPTQASVKPQTPVLEKGKDAVTISQVRQHNEPKFSAPKVLGLGSGSNSYQDLFAPKKQGPDVLVISIIVGIVIILLVGAGMFFWMMQSNKKQMEDSGAAAAVEEQIRSLETERENTERKAEEERKAQQLKEFEQKQKAEKEEAERVRKQQEAENAAKEKENAEAREAAKKREEIAKCEAEDAKKLAETRNKQRTAFSTAKVEGKGVPPKPQTGFAKALESPSEFRVYYYAGMALTNEVAGYKAKNDPLNRQKIIDHTLWVREPQLKVSPIKDSPVAIWMAGNKVWFDWSQRENKRRMWFKESASHDLQIDCFGISEDVFETWNKAYPVTYIISWGEDEGQSAPWKSREFKLSDAIDLLCKQEMERLKKKIAATEEDIKRNNESIDKVKKEKAELDEHLKKIAAETNKLETLRSELKDLREDWRQAEKNEKKFDDKAEEEFKKKQRELKKKINEQEAKVQELPIKKVKIEATQKKDKLEQLEGQVEKLDKELKLRKKVYERAQKDPNREGKVRDTSFSVSVKGVN
jgi:flagellar biosynthesis GTPase FlhF